MEKFSILKLNNSDIIYNTSSKLSTNHTMNLNQLVIPAIKCPQIIPLYHDSQPAGNISKVHWPWKPRDLGCILWPAWRLVLFRYRGRNTGRLARTPLNQVYAPSSSWPVLQKLCQHYNKKITKQIKHILQSNNICMSRLRVLLQETAICVSPISNGLTLIFVQITIKSRCEKFIVASKLQQYK